MKLSRRVNQFTEYAFSALLKKKAEVEKKTGRKVLDLSIGSPDFPPSKIYIKKLKEFLDEKTSHLYPGYGAIPELSKALQNWYKKRFGVELKGNELYPLLGGKDGVSHLTFVLTDEGDEVLVPDPGYPAFSGSAIMIGTKPVLYDLTEKNDFMIDLNQLAKKISKKTKFIWVNFPANPTGQIIKLDELGKIVNFCRKYKIWLVYDNAYSEITFDNHIAPSILQVKGANKIAVEIGSFSKTLSFAGYRMGWVVGNDNVIKALSRVKSQVDSGMSLAFQKLGAYSLNNYDVNWHKQMIESYEQRADIIVDYLKRIGLDANKKLGSLYLWVRIPDSYKNSRTFVEDFLIKKQILLAPGEFFGRNGKKYVRVSICSNINNIEEYFI